MPIKPLRTDADLRAVFHRLEGIFQADEGTPEADERDVLVTLIEVYENKHYAFGPADPVEAIKFRMEQQGLTARDLEAYIGPWARLGAHQCAQGRGTHPRERLCRPRQRALSVERASVRPKG